MTDTKHPGVRTRFAPSPTGSLHVGGARTALFAWLFARQAQGTFILRIEDTDLERSTPESVQAILDGLSWLKIDYDEGPFYQTKRFDRYQAVAELLLQEGKAYKCYCTKARLDQLRETQMQAKQKPRYDGCCRHQAAHAVDAPYVVRFRNPEEGAVSFVDMIRGAITVDNRELDDLIIVRSDGTPTYNFTVVVDDWEMNITHVIRGDDHINNTPRQINLFQALNAPIPVYGHVPMILGGDGQRLSKRHGAEGVMTYRDMGFLPDALVNYLVRLGWGHGDQEIFSREEMIAHFDVRTVSRSPAIFNMEKLLWLNQQYLKIAPPWVLADGLQQQLMLRSLEAAGGPALESVVAVQAERVKTLAEMAERSRYFYDDHINYVSDAVTKHLKRELMEPLRQLSAQLANVSVWEASAIHEIVLAVAQQYELPLGKLAQPIRVAMTGDTVSPPIDSTLYLIGKTRVLKRLHDVIAMMSAWEVSQ